MNGSILDIECADVIVEDGVMLFINSEKLPSLIVPVAHVAYLKLDESVC